MNNLKIHETEMEVLIVDALKDRGEKNPITFQELWRAVGSPKQEEGFVFETMLLRMRQDEKVKSRRRGEARFYWI